MQNDVPSLEDEKQTHIVLALNWCPKVYVMFHYDVMQFFFFFFCGQCALRQDTINRIHFAVSDKEVGYRDVVCIICIFITTVI